MSRVVALLVTAGIIALIIGIVIYVVPFLFNVYKGYCMWAWFDQSCNGIRTQIILENQQKNK